MVSVYPNLPFGHRAHTNARVVALVINVADERDDPLLKLALGHDGLLLGVIVFPLPNIRERRTRQIMQLLDHRADDPLDMSAVPGLLDGSEAQMNSMHLA